MNEHSDAEVDVTVDDDLMDGQALDALVGQYLSDRPDLGDGEQATELRAAFTAGIALRTVEPVDLYDPIDRATVRVPPHATLAVATHEGDVLVGQLTDNSHSLGVLYEEAHRWYRRKYFLPLSTLVDRAQIEVLGAAAAEGEGGAPVGAVRGLGVDAHTRHVAVAVRRIEQLVLHDESALLPRGTVIVLRGGAVGRDAESGAEVALPEGAEVEVVAAMGDYMATSDMAELDALVAAAEDEGEGAEEETPEDAPEPDQPDDTYAAGSAGAAASVERVPDDVIRVRAEGRTVDLPAAILASLDPDADVLSWHQLEARRQRLESRRRFLRRAIGGGLALGLLGATTPYLLSRRDDALRTRERTLQRREREVRERERELEAGDVEDLSDAEGARRRLEDLRARMPREATQEAARDALRFVVPEVAAAYGVVTSGGKYWFDVKGALMSLQREGALDAVRTLAEVTEPTADALEDMWRRYKSSYYCRVHVAWREHRHYRTDKDGNRRYTHSTWSRVYRRMWVEPSQLAGFHDELGGWRRDAATYGRKSHRLAHDPLYDLLAADPDDAEGTFHLARVDLSARYDMVTSAVWMALCAAPPAFLETVVDEIADSRRRGDRVVAQREGALGLGVMLGIVTERVYTRKLGRRLRQNKYDLGATLEREIARVRTLSLDAAFKEYFVGRGYRAWPDDVSEWSRGVRALQRLATDHVYVHGSGWSHGKPLSPCHVRAGAVREAAPRLGDALWHGHLAAARYVAEPYHAEALLPVLRNAVGTEILRAQIREDEGEAKSGNWKRSLWFSLPLWGLALIDLAVRET